MSGLVSNTAFLVATWIAAIFGGVGIAAAFVSAIVGYQLTENALSDANERISIAREEAKADVEKAAIEANKKIEEAKAETAEAVAEAARANERAAELMKATAWRQFTPDQLSKLRDALSNQSGKYVAAWIANDPESLALALQFINLLASIPGKWDMVNSAKVYPVNLIWGVRIPDVQGAEATVTTLRHAFTEAGISFSTEVLPQETMSYGISDASVLAGRAIVLFGSRLPSFVQPPN